MDLQQLAATLSDAGGDAPLPVEQWNPAHCGEMDLLIKADGSWWHEGTRITRAPLVRLFSRVLRKDPDGHVLVTPAEKISIKVEDTPFLAVDFDQTEGGFTFLTNVGDRVLIDRAHPISMRSSKVIGQRAPYILVRGALEARIDRPAYYRLMNDLPEREGSLVMNSGGAEFNLEIEPIV